MCASLFKYSSTTLLTAARAIAQGCTVEVTDVSGAFNPLPCVAISPPPRRPPASCPSDRAPLPRPAPARMHARPTAHIRARLCFAAFAFLSPQNTEYTESHSGLCVAAKVDAVAFLTSRLQPRNSTAKASCSSTAWCAVFATRRSRMLFSSHLVESS